VTLPASGRLIGQGVTGASFDAVMGITPPATAIPRPAIGGTAPVIQGTVNMNGSNTEVRGLRIQPPSGSEGLAATLAGPFTGLAVSDIPNITTSNAGAVNLNNVTGVFHITQVNASGAFGIGINLNNANPSSGSFTVAGSGGTCTAATPTCSGGTITNATDASVKLANTSNVSLTRMRLNSSGNFGLSGNTVNVMNINTCVFSGTHGNLVDEGALFVTNWLGSGTITDSDITGGANDIVRVTNTTGVLNRLTVSGTTIHDHVSAAPSNHGLRFATNLATTNTGAGVVMNITVQNSTFRNSYANHLDFAATGLSAMNIVLTGNTMTKTVGYATLSGAVNTVADHQSQLTFNYDSNNLTFSNVTAFNFFTSNLSTAAMSMVGRFNNNTIGQAGVATSGSVGGGVTVNATGAGTVTANITNNAIHGIAGNYGIYLLGGDGSPILNGTVTGNTIGTYTGGFNGIHARSGTVSSDSTAICAHISGNNVVGAGPTNEIFLWERFGATSLRLPGYAGAATDTAAAAAFVAGQNTATAGRVSATGNNFLGGAAACPSAP
jgi:hypothetical protein